MSWVPERVAGVPAAHVRYASWTRGLAEAQPTHGLVLLPRDGDPSYAGWPEGNRSIVLTEVKTHWMSRNWMLSIKGVGARFPMFGEVSTAPRRHASSAEPARRHFSAECWFGESPWGAQGDEGVANGLRVTHEAPHGFLFGMPICPVLSAAQIPPDQIDCDEPRYRAYRGGFWQEQRLVPSRIRLGDQSELTLAFDPEGALQRLGVASIEALDPFIERLLVTGLRCLTLAVHSAVAGEQGVTAYRFAHVWLDKDTLVAPDGTLCFADLEGLERVPVADFDALQRLATRQLDDHIYELLYAVDRLLHVSEGWRDRPLDVVARRRDLACRLELALSGDADMKVARGSEGWALAVRAPAWPDRSVTLPLFCL